MAIDQFHAEINVEPYIIEGYGPRRMPMAPALGHSIATVAVPNVVKETALQLSVNMGTQARWLANAPHFFQTGTVFGDGLVHWTPSQGSLATGLSTEPRWKFDPLSAPALDPGYSWKLPNKKTRAFPALVFRNGAWGLLHGFPDQRPGYTTIFVIRVLRPATGAYANIFASYTDPLYSDTSATSKVLYYSHNGHIRTFRGRKNHYISQRMTQTQRPIILAVREQTSQTTTIIGTHAGWDRKVFKHDKIKHFDLSWYLAREAGAYYRSRTLYCEIVEICLWDHARTDAQMSQDVRKLDRLYGALAR